MAKPYSMDRKDNERMYDRAWELVSEGKDWATVADTILDEILTTQYAIEGLDLLPTEGRIFIASNHRMHGDYFLTGAALRQRPDLKMVARVPPAAKESFPSRSKFLETSSAFIPLQSTDIGGYVQQSLDLLRQQIQEDVSMIMVPCGVMDFQMDPKNDAHSAESAVRNVLHLVGTKTPTQVFTAFTQIESQGDVWPGPLPLRNIKTTIQGPFHSNKKGDIEQAIRDLHQKSAS